MFVKKAFRIPDYSILKIKTARGLLCIWIFGFFGCIKKVIKVSPGPTLRIEIRSNKVILLQAAGKQESIFQKYIEVFNSLLMCVLGVSKFFCGELFLRGVGARVKLKGRELYKKKLLIFAGKSHLITTCFWGGLKILSVGRRKLIFKSASFTALTRAISFIQHLSFPDPYKGKGFRSRYSFKLLKTIRQRGRFR